MAFVNEWMSKEEEEAFKKRNIPAPTWTLRTLESCRWTVDRERDLFLVWASQLREDNHNKIFFVFGWRGNYIQMLLKKTYPNSTTRQWSFIEFNIPEELNKYKKQIIINLKEALTVYGYDGDPNDPDNNRNTVEFNF